MSLCPQAQAIKTHLQKDGSISNVEAQAIYRCRALPRRIADIKQDDPDFGSRIYGQMRADQTGQRYKRYFLQQA